jgi:hypothetical protein
MKLQGRERGLRTPQIQPVTALDGRIPHPHTSVVVVFEGPVRSPSLARSPSLTGKEKGLHFSLQRLVTPTIVHRERLQPSDWDRPSAQLHATILRDNQCERFWVGSDETDRRLVSCSSNGLQRRFDHLLALGLGT